MTVSDLTRNSVLQALAEFDELGRDAFLDRYKFGKARGYFVVNNGRRYDSKAIAGAAHAYTSDGAKTLKASDFSGGEKTVAARLRELGFTVTEPVDRVEEPLPFEVGNVYHRQRDIHEVYGGQERGGIATPDGVPYVFLFTGETGEQYGYSDGWRPDGIFAYTGEGQHGDMEFVRGNRAIRDHLTDGRDLLLFEATKTKGTYRFRGCFGCAGWETQKAPDKDGISRDAIVFHLVPISEIETETAEPPESPDKDRTKTLEELRLSALAATKAPQVPPKDSRRAYFKRSAAVKFYVLARAAGHCKSCGKPAPFLRKDGRPYLEPHHILRLADEGPDHPRWVGAVCPSCHREIHHGVDGHAKNLTLKQKLGDLWDAAEKAATSP